MWSRFSTVGITSATCRDAEYSYAAVTVSVIYFIIFIVMSAFVLFSLFVGIVTTSMNKATAKMQAPGTRTHKQTHKHTNTKVQEDDTPLGIHPPPPGRVLCRRHQGRARDGAGVRLVITAAAVQLELEAQRLQSVTETRTVRAERLRRATRGRALSAYTDPSLQCAHALAGRTHARHSTCGHA
jgi:hypothetical protein